MDALVRKLKKADMFAVDAETTGVDPMQAEIVGVSFSVTPGEAFYIPVGHYYLGVRKQLDRDFVLNRLKPLLEVEEKIW